MLKKILQLKTANPIIGFAVGFIAIFLVLYFGNQFFIGITAPGNIYIEFLDSHLNYINWFRTTLLTASKFTTELFGHHSTINKYSIVLDNGATIGIVYACLGIGILSVWWAFVLSFPQKIDAKIKYLFLGSLFIVIINVLRISALALIFSKQSTTQYREINHHLIFNIACYILVFFMMKRWIDKAIS